MRLLAATLLVLAMGTPSLHAQQSPFDMTPERPPMQPAETEEAQADEAPRESEPRTSDIRRYLLPSGDLSLAGENAARSWVIGLTSAQAASPARLNLGYQNSVVTAPEASRLQLLVNGMIVLDEPLRSTDGVDEMVADLPPDLLRAGHNEISLRAWHRHRTDCTIESTYELWTNIDAARTYISFEDAAAGDLSTFEDLRTLGPDASGRFPISIIAPAIASGDIGAELMRLVQAVALHTNLPNLNFSIHPAPVQDDGARLRVALGSADELARIGDLQVGSPSGPIASFLPRSGDEPPTLVVSGRNREDWLAAIDRMLAPADRPTGGMRDVLMTENWRAPNAPMIYDRAEFSFAELGIRSERFSGRRHSTSFQFAVPADFYAGSYGEARILLDAAQTDAVMPGSMINIYVNGSIASSTPLAASRARVFDRLPIRLTMRHFEPGLNEVAIETILSTEQDEACMPGATADETSRFAVFDTSRFILPTFGRIGQRPDLSALGGTAFPYGLAQRPIAIVVDRSDTTELSAAANMLARMALSAGRSIPTAFTSSSDAARGSDAIFIGAINDVSTTVLGHVGVTERSRTAWGVSHGRAAPADGQQRTDAELWRQQMESRNWMSDVGEWFSETFGLTADMLRFIPTADTAFSPSQPAILLVAQEQNPVGNGVWTLVTAPDGAMLKVGTDALTDLDNWRRLSGRATTLESDLETVNALPVTTSFFVETQPRSLSNFRLILANWLSSNILSYALLLVVFCLLLGIATFGLLTRLGRRN